MKSISLKAYAKINLSLDVLGTLENGYHEVRMIMQNVDMYDKVNMFRNKSGEINIKSNLSFVPTGPDNLVYKAIRLLLDEYNITDGVEVDLYKYIPVAAGMAGGSTDAAAALIGVNKMFGLGLTREELMVHGKKIGADVPYCILGGTALAEGIGEKLTVLPDCPNCYIVVAKPGISVSTKYVYDNLVLDENTKHPDVDSMIKEIENKNIVGVAQLMGNVLESVTEAKYPVIADIKKMMLSHNAMGAMMSGSGPTVFGLFENEGDALACENKLRASAIVKNSYVTRFVNGGMKDDN